MIKNVLISRKMRFGLVVGTALVGAGLVVANSAAIAQPIEEVIVTAPRTVHQTIGRSSITGAPIELISIARQVSYADLDLSKTSDANELEKRVDDTARDLCQELDKMYPLEPKDRNCVSKASDDARKQVDAAIAGKTR